MADRRLVATHLPTLEADALAALAALNGRTLAAELRLIYRAHVRSSAAALENGAPGQTPERSERPVEGAEPLGRAAY